MRGSLPIAVEHTKLFTEGLIRCELNDETRDLSLSKEEEEELSKPSSTCWNLRKQHRTPMELRLLLSSAIIRFGFLLISILRSLKLIKDS